MRLYFHLTANSELVPFDYQNYLISKFHKWMGINGIHDEISLYSISWLQNSKLEKTGFTFPNGSVWFISFWDDKIGKQLISSAMRDPDICCGMRVKEIKIQEVPKFREKEKFIAASPIFIRKYDEKRKATHLTYKNEDADYYLTETLKNKLKSAKLNYDVKVSFDRTHLKSKTKLVRINNINNRASFCPVIIEGNPEAISFAWIVGIGHSTGCGFGALK